MANICKYKPEFCQMLIEHMAEGYSFESFAKVAGVMEITLYRWTQPDGDWFKPDFYEAKQRAFAENRYFWESKGISGLTTKEFNATIWVFNMKNRFGWRDKQEMTHQGPNEGPIQVQSIMAKDPAEMTPDERKAVIDEVTRG
jgi:hypothetical protein